MSDKDIFQISRVTTCLGIEVGTAITQTAVADNLHHGLGQFVIVDRELVCIPSVLIIATVSVNRSQHSVIYRNSQFMFKCMTSQRSMIHFNVHLEILVQPVSFQEPYHSFGIHIILMLSRLHRFGFNQEGTCKPFAPGIIAGDGQHLSQMFFLTLLICIQ